MQNGHRQGSSVKVPIMNEHIRKCIGCNEKFNRGGMLRVLKNSANGEIILNPDTKTFGRSAYLCKNPACIENAFKKGRIFKLLKTKPDESLKEKILSF